MSVFTGRTVKGAMRAHRESKRRAAQIRTALAVHQRTRAHRERRCDRGCS